MLNSTSAPISALPTAPALPTAVFPVPFRDCSLAKRLPLVWAIALSLGMATSSVLFPSSAHADDEQAPATGRSTGSRGCGVAEAPPTATPLSAPADVPALILLAPSDQRGRTVSTRPTFAWFVRDRTPMPLEFRIYEQTGTSYILIQEVKGDTFRSVPGIMTLPTLNGLPALSPGKRYRWQVELVCNPARPSGNLFAEAEVDVVPLTPALQRQLFAAKAVAPSATRLNQAQIYAQANLWYDALATTLPPYQDSRAVQDFRRTLLDRIAANPAERQWLHQSAISPSVSSSSLLPPSPVLPKGPQLSGR